MSTDSIEDLFDVSDHEYLSFGNLEDGLIVNSQSIDVDDFDNEISEDQALDNIDITEVANIFSTGPITGKFVDVVDIGSGASLSDHNYTNSLNVQMPTANMQLALLVQKNASHKCECCEKLFANSTLLHKHLRSHTKEQPYKCQICDKRFSQQSNLWKHIKIHTGDKPFTCPQCKKRFSQRANMQKHQLIHSGVKPHDCPYCFRTFTQLVNRDKHVQLHIGTRLHKCQYCDKTFSQRSNLINHQHVHEGVKPFNCEVCRASFTQKNHLNKHLALHTGEKPYNCSNCGKTYIQKINLMGHQQLCMKQKAQTFNNIVETHTNSNFTIIQMDGSEDSYYVNEHKELIKLETNSNVLEVEEGDSNQSSFCGSA